MAAQNKKKAKKVDLLEMHNPERIRLLEKIRKQLKQKIEEAKLMHSLLQVENLTVNGSIVYKENERLTGFSFSK
ncbi:MAG: hypothetical protein QXQ94_02325 [Candidatus Bathyarchaeia archaeon]